MNKGSKKLKKLLKDFKNMTPEEYMKIINSNFINKCSRCKIENPITLNTIYGKVCAHCKGDIISILKNESNG